MGRTKLKKTTRMVSYRLPIATIEKLRDLSDMDNRNMTSMIAALIDDAHRYAALNGSWPPVPGLDFHTLDRLKCLAIGHRIDPVAMTTLLIDHGHAHSLDTGPSIFTDPDSRWIDGGVWPADKPLPPKSPSPTLAGGKPQPYSAKHRASQARAARDAARAVKVKAAKEREDAYANAPKDWTSDPS